MFEITHETPNSSKILTEDALNFLGKFISAFEERRKQQMAALVEQLNLTEEQKAKFDDINEFYRNKFQEIRNNNQGDRQSMREAIMQIREEQDIELEALLTPEQYQTYKKFQEEQRQNRRGRGGRRGGNRG